MQIRLALVLAATLAAPALAQLPPVIASTQPYQPLTAGTVVAALNGDDMGVLVPLGFTFPWFGQSYTHVMLSSNGVIVPGISTTTTCSSGCLSNESYPNANSPNPSIAGYWDDLDLRSTSGGGVVRTLQQPGQFTVEYAAVARYGTSNASAVTFQIRLTAAGSVSIHYGSLVGTSTSWSASSGFEDGTGALGANFLSACTSACTAANFPPSGTMFTVGEPDGPDLAVSQVTIANFVQAMDGNLTFDVNATLRNFGRTDANNFSWKAFLSRDQQLDLTATDGGADIEVLVGGTQSLPGVDGGFLPDGGLSIVNVTGIAATTTAPPTGEYFVLVQVDPTDAVMEASEANNVGSTLTAFVQGTDLVATSLTGPVVTGGGNTESFTLSFYNRGTTPAGTVTFRLLLSADQAYDASDFVVFTDTRQVSGGQTISETLSAVMPANVPNGQFYWLLQVDPAGAVVEANETNNVVSSGATVDVRRADLVAELVEFQDPLTGLPVSTARFGEPVQLSLRYRNVGGANANNFRVALVLSIDSSVSLLSDTYVCDQTIAQALAGAPAATVTLSCTLPTANAVNVPFSTGPYFLFGIVDSSGAVFESNKANNTLMVGPVRVSSPGPDLAVTNVTAPATAGVGEVIPVVRTLRNFGNLDAGEVAYRYFASANEIITTDDVPLRIVDGTSSRDEGRVTLARGVSNSATELLRLPGTMPAGTWYVGCIIDPGLTVGNDLDFTNNALASRQMVVAPTALKVVNTVLPDGVVGRPFSFRLSAAGEQGASTWSIDPTLGGAPGWLSIGASDGLLSGTPDRVGTEGVTVVVENGGRQAAVRLALRVLPTTTGLAITTPSLPAVVNSSLSQYQYALGAAGGQRPYAWRLASGSLPMGLVLGADGLLFGSPRNAPNGNTALTVEVRDATGATAQRTLALRLIAAGSIQFRTVAIPDGLVGQDYLEDIAVQNQDGTALARPLTWRVSGALPAGLVVTPQSELITVAGRPSQAGTFTFGISVEDVNGRADSLEYTLTVHAARYRVLAALPEVLYPDEVVAIPLRVAPQGEVTWRLVNGALPPGLTLEPAGVISGTVPADGAVGDWNFALEVRDATGMTGLGALSLRVERRPRTVGCSAVGVELAPLALLGLLAWRRRRPERR